MRSLGHGDAELVGEVGRDVEDLPLGILVVRIPDQRLHLDQVDHALEVVFRADRQLHRQRARAEALLDHVHAAHEVRAAAVHLVHVADARHVVVVGEAPVGLRLRLDARHAVEHHDRAVEHAQRAVHLDGEVDVSRGVDEVDLLVAPEGGHRGALNRDAALLLLLQVVSGRRGLQILGIVDVDDRVLAPRVIQDALGRRRLAGVDVGDDADIADVGKGGCTGHSKFPLQVEARAVTSPGAPIWRQVRGFEGVREFWGAQISRKSLKSRAILVVPARPRVPGPGGSSRRMSANHSYRRAFTGFSAQRGSSACSPWRWPASREGRCGKPQGLQIHVVGEPRQPPVQHPRANRPGDEIGPEHRPGGLPQQQAHELGRSGPHSLAHADFLGSALGGRRSDPDQPQAGEQQGAAGEHEQGLGQPLDRDVQRLDVVVEEHAVDWLAVAGRPPGEVDGGQGRR